MLPSLLFLLPGLFQKGDVPGEVQGTLPPDLRVPPAPARSPAEELRTFTVQPGYAVELAACEPEVEAPVQVQFDAQGRMWVVEMRGYMPDVDGNDERQPRGRIAILTDRDGDGRYETRTTFLEALVLATTVLPVPGGALVVEPPALWMCHDPDGDGRCDRREQLLDDIAGDKNPEHGGNHLTPALDNWIWFANHPKRLRLMAGRWQFERTLARGQWGLCFDDFGRPYFNYNSDYLFTSFVPLCYADAAGTNEQVDRDQSVWPARITPGVNRGYQKGILREWQLARFTAACAPHVYRGDALPECAGDAFVCEPAANFVRRTRLTERDGRVTGRNAYAKAEFLAATDERFRPVDLATGPDGALYVVDMYRGVIQHRNFVTTWLRRQVLQRQLEQPLDQGRIWRVVAAGRRPAPPRPLAGRTAGELVASLASANGWERDTAQRLLIERKDPSVQVPLRALALADAAVPRLHALWTLEALGQLDPELLQKALGAPAAQVRLHALRLLEATPALARAHETLATLALAALRDAAREVRVQASLTLGVLGLPAATAPLVAAAVEWRNDPLFRQAVAVAGAQAPQVFAPALAAAFATAESAPSGSRPTEPRAFELLRALGLLTARGRVPERIDALLAALPGPPFLPWQQAALLEGLAQGRPRGADPKVEVPREPEALIRLLGHADPAVRRQSTQVAAFLRWPGKVEAASRPGLQLDADELKRHARGRELFGGACAPCHQPGGEGRVGLAPPFLGSAWVSGPAERLGKILLHGVHGPMEVAGQKWELEMPSFAWLEDADLAAVLTFVRSEWGENAGPVAPATIEALRKSTATRAAPWTAEELLR